MVKRYTHSNDPKPWIANLEKSRGKKAADALHTALDLYQELPTRLVEKGLSLADVLLNLGLDTETVLAGFIYPAIQEKEIHLDTITDSFGLSCNKLLHDVLQLQTLRKLPIARLNTQHQLENLRKMLLAIVTDVRAVLIILAERLWELHEAKTSPNDVQIKLAKETLDIFAPLANRLGIWQLKWELEDLCFRYLKPQEYSAIAKWLAERRQEREGYVEGMIVEITNLLSQGNQQNFQISGRVKHIYSIYQKMQRKNVSIEQIYDISALRILVPEIQDCYAVLGILQNNFAQVLHEFDDYISQPKPNGYRSIHIVIISQEKKFIEIQIRTFAMHQECELGVMAHWQYKEGVLQTGSYEAKIALLRQLMAWQRELVDANPTEEVAHDLFADRVYVFTPLGDIVDLPKGATPLDFAYHIHSEVGHRCRGAKINGSIVTIKHALQTGDRVEILTAKEAHPSRDWLNPHLGYLKTARARAKAQHWFRMHEEQSSKLEEKEGPRAQPVEVLMPTTKSHEVSNVSEVQILGMNNLLTQMALCCKPLPGDEVIGYITRARGISIHRQDCKNIQHASMNNPARLIQVNWGEKLAGKYPVDLQLRVTNRSGLIRDITTLLAGEKINLLGVNTQQVQKPSQELDIFLTIEIDSRADLKKVIDILRGVNHVIEVRRR